MAAGTGPYVFVHILLVGAYSLVLLKQSEGAFDLDYKLFGILLVAFRFEWISLSVP